MPAPQIIDTAALDGFAAAVFSLNAGLGPAARRRAGCAASCIPAAGSTSAGPRASRWPRRSSPGDAVSAVRRAAGLRPAPRRRLRRGAGRRARRPARRPAARGGRPRRDLGQHPPGAAGARRRLRRGAGRGCCRASASSPSSPTIRSAGGLPPVPPLRRKLELGRLIARLVAAEPRARVRRPRPSTSPTASPSSSTRCRARRSRSTPSRRSTPASMPRTGSAACGS